VTTNQKRNYKDRQYGDQKCEDTKGVIRSHKYKDRQYGDQKCEDTKGVIRSVSIRTDNTVTKSVQILKG
jgi:hypothetical protein